MVVAPLPGRPGIGTGRVAPVSDVSDVSGGSDDFAEHTVDPDLEAARRQLAEVPVEDIVANHAIGLWELAAIHLQADPPDLAAATLAIDAVAALVDGVGSRLGNHTATLRDALANIRMAYVSVSSRG